MSHSFFPMAERAVLVRFTGGISEATRARVHSLFHALKRQPTLALHPAYASLLIEFDPEVESRANVEQRVESLLQVPERDRATRLIEVPVVYDGADLAEVAELLGMAPEALVKLHSSVIYTAVFLGFQPGFAYLDGLPESLTVPRLSSPRLKVPAGSVAIAGRQTGIYPVTSPGGWRLLGRTGLAIFSPEQDPPVLIGMGDRVKFVPVETLP